MTATSAVWEREVPSAKSMEMAVTKQDFLLRNCCADHNNLKRLLEEVGFLVFLERRNAGNRGPYGEITDWQIAEYLIQAYLEHCGERIVYNDARGEAREIIRFWKSPEYLRALSKKPELRFSHY